MSLTEMRSNMDIDCSASDRDTSSLSADVRTRRVACIMNTLQKYSITRNVVSYRDKLFIALYSRL